MTDLCKWMPAKSKVFPGGDTGCHGKYVAKMTLASQPRVLTVSRVALGPVHLLLIFQRCFMLGPMKTSSSIFHAHDFMKNM